MLKWPLNKAYAAVTNILTFGSNIACVHRQSSISLESLNTACNTPQRAMKSFKVTFRQRRSFKAPEWSFFWKQLLKYRKLCFRIACQHTGPVSLFQSNGLLPQGPCL